uniref:BHLH domain-containing protein n=1 Tax=Rhodnius prolixus TaxID=13249 RepID=T1HBE5_RHOPR
MAQKIQLNNWTSTNKHSPKETIHSGHFMVSDFEAEEQDEDDLAVPVPEEVEIKATNLNDPTQNVAFLNDSNLEKSVGHQLSIETSLSKLFQCMSLAYRQKLTSPKWNRFKGIRLRWKDKIRLNNVIWRCWHIQFINKQKTLVCQFASPLDVDTHKKPEAVVLEGKYWKRKLNAVTAEYKKWRMYSHNQILGRPQKYQDVCTDIDSQDYWTLAGGDNMMVDEDYMGLMTDTLFSTISAQPFPFPDPREIARNTNLADFIQPSLVQLQPNLDEIMEIEPLQADLLQSSKLSTVPEESGVLQTVPSYQSKLVTATGDAIGSGFAQNSYGPAETMWYLPPEFVDVTAQAPPPTSLPPPPYPQSRMQTSSAAATRQVSMHIPAPPPPPPSPLLSKGDVYTPPKNKTKGRTRNSTTKKMTLYASNNQQQALLMPMMTTTSPPQQEPPNQQQSSTLLAQMLTNNSNANYGFLPKEQSQQSASPTKRVSLSSNCEEQPFIQQLFASIDNQVIYKPDNVPKGAGTYVVNTDNKANSSVTSQRTSPVITSVLNKSMQQSITNMGNVCTDPLATPELSLSPLNVGSPKSPPASKEAPPAKDQRRVCHINAEQKRRCNIKNGFDTLHSLIPQLSQNPNAKMSKASMLQKGAEYISNCQALLPATGAPISRHRSSKMRDMFKQHVKTRTQENWKYWLLSLICEPLLESFNNYVSTNSLDELYHTTLQWVEQHCTLVILRQRDLKVQSLFNFLYFYCSVFAVVLNSLRQLCTSTEVLTDPARLPNEAIAAVDKSNKKQS